MTMVRAVAAGLLAAGLVGCTLLPTTESGSRLAERVVQAQLEAYNRRDLDAFIVTYHPDVKLYRMPTQRPTLAGRTALAEFYRTSRFNRPALHAEVLYRTTLGSDTVVDHERIHGLRDTPLEAVVVYRVAEGLISEVWIFAAE